MSRAPMLLAGGAGSVGCWTAQHLRTPQATPVVLGTEWLVGATTVPTLAFATAFGWVHAIAIGALLDEQDACGAPRRHGEQGWI